MSTGHRGAPSQAPKLRGQGSLGEPLVFSASVVVVFWWDFLKVEDKILLL